MRFLSFISVPQPMGTMLHESASLDHASTVVSFTITDLLLGKAQPLMPTFNAYARGV